MTDKLSIALNQLDDELSKRQLRLELVICGAYAIQLSGYLRSEPPKNASRKILKEHEETIRDLSRLLE